MSKITIAFTSFLLITGTLQLRAQDTKIKNAPTPADSTDININNLLNPFIQNYEYQALAGAIHYQPNNFKVSYSFLFHIASGLALAQVTDDIFDPKYNYIFSRNIYEYKFRLERVKRYPKNRYFYKDGNNSLLENYLNSILNE